MKATFQVSWVGPALNHPLTVWRVLRFDSATQRSGTVVVDGLKSAAAARKAARALRASMEAR